MDATSLIALNAIIGFFLPLLIAPVARCSFPEWLRALIALGICMVAGFVTALASGQWAWANLTVSIGVVLVSAWSSFSRFWNKTGVIDKINTLTGG